MGKKSDRKSDRNTGILLFIITVVILLSVIGSGCLKLEYDKLEYDNSLGGGLGMGMDAITGGVVIETLEVPFEKEEFEEPEIIKEPEKQDPEESEEQCTDECSPAGSACSEGIMHQCRAGISGCLEYIKTACLYGCDGEQCAEKQESEEKNKEAAEKKAGEQQPKSQKEILTERDVITTDDNCTGKILGIVQWNPHGSLCRVEGRGATTSGIVNPVNCCSKYFYNSQCTKNLGIIKRGLVESSQYFGIGCYEG